MSVFAEKGLTHVSGIGDNRFGNKFTQSPDWPAPRCFASALFEHRVKNEDIVNVRHYRDPPFNEEEEIDGMTNYDNPTRGFVIHSLCWTLLEKAFHPKPVPFERIFELCCLMVSETPREVHELAVWGYERGAFRHVNILSPMENWWEAPLGKRMKNRDADPLNLTSQDPYEATREGPSEQPWKIDFDPLLASSDTPPTSDIETSPDGNTDDVFFRLPEEIRLLIAQNLLAADALRLRQASRPFLFIFNDDLFWKSTFLPGGQNDWFFEAEESATRVKDCRSLHRGLYVRIYRHMREEYYFGLMLYSRYGAWKAIRHIQILLDQQEKGLLGLASSEMQGLNCRS